MSTRIACDGCELDLREDQVELTGKRANLRGDIGAKGLIPKGEFHLCFECAATAFHAMAMREPGDGVDSGELAWCVLQARLHRRDLQG